MAEKIVSVRRPLKSALDAIGGSQTILSSTNLKLCIAKFPKKPIEHEPKQELPIWGTMKDHWVTGLTGNTTTQVSNAGLEKVKRTLNKGDPWTIRWDYDDTKGSHVNLEFGPNPQSKIAFCPPPPSTEKRSMYYLDAIKDMTDTVGYRTHDKAGTPGQRIYAAVNTGGSEGASEGETRLEEQKQLSAAAVELAEKWAGMYA